MKSPIFEEVIDHCRKIATASQEENEQAREIAYQNLIKLCAKHENTPRDHPFQWEALAEFTLDAEQALDIYEKGLAVAQKMSLIDAQASIYLAMIHRQIEIEQLEQANNHLDSVLALQAQIENSNIVEEIEVLSAKLKSLSN